MTTPTYTINTPLINYFLYNAGPNIGKPLVNGKIYFYSDPGYSVFADTYSDIADPNNPTVNTNPIDLGEVGECPVIYLQNIPYYIQIFDSNGKPSGQLIQSYAGYRGAAFTGGSSPPPTPSDGFSGNLLANGQFNYPVEFSLEGDGQLTNQITNVALAWEFTCDYPDSNNISFQDVSNQQLEGNPQNLIVLTSTGVEGEANKQLSGVYGAVDSFIGDDITVSFQGINLNSGTIPVTLILYQNFGEGGSEPVSTELGTFTLTQVIQKFYLSTTPPSTAGMTIGQGNYASIQVQFPLGSSCKIGITNVLDQLGVFDPPIYLGDANANEKSQILGAITQLQPLGLNQEGYPMTYTQGEILPSSNTGIQFFSVPTLLPAFALPCLGQTLLISDSSNGIPNSRLYSVIGTQYGGSGDLIITASGNVVTFTTYIGAKENSAYTAGTTSFTVANPVTALAAGLSLSLLEPNVVQATFLNNFAPVQNGPNNSGLIGGNNGIPNSVIGSLYQRIAFSTNPAGNNAIVTTTIIPGSISTAAVCNIAFNSLNANDYLPLLRSIGAITYTAQYNSLNLASFATNTRGNYSRRTGPDGPYPLVLSPISIQFSVNGATGPTLGGGLQQTITVPFLASNNLQQNIQAFINTVANPFIWTVTVTAVPAASSYFLYSSSSTNYYAWYKVDGAGTDPAIGGRTGIEIDTLSTDDTGLVAQKTALALNSLQFTLPAQQVLDDLVSVNFINL